MRPSSSSRPSPLWIWASGRIPVQYAKRVVGRKQYGGQSTFIPMKVNQSGVMPLIFAMTFVQIPGMIAQFCAGQRLLPPGVNQCPGNGQLASMRSSIALLILFFSYFYAQIAFNPVDVSKNIQQYGGFIPGIRPGRAHFGLSGQAFFRRITLFGAIFLAVGGSGSDAVLQHMSGMNTAFGATSLLIMVSVSLETTKQLESADDDASL